MLRNTCISALAASALAATGPTWAAEPVADPAPITAVPMTSAARANPMRPADATGVISNEELGELRGGQGVVLSDQTLVAITSGNVIHGDYVAGDVSLSDNALSNFNGLGNVLINTGAQVSLQTGMSVTINVGE